MSFGRNLANKRLREKASPEDFWSSIDALLGLAEGSPVLTDELSTLADAYANQESGDDVLDALDAIANSDEMLDEVRDYARAALAASAEINKSSSRLKRKASRKGGSPFTRQERSESGIGEALDHVSQCAEAAGHFWTAGDADEAMSALDDLIAEAKAAKQKISSHGENYPAEEPVEELAEASARAARIATRSKSYSTMEEGDTAPLRKAMDQIYGAGQDLNGYQGPDHNDSVKGFAQQAIDLANDIEALADEIDTSMGEEHAGSAVRRGAKLETKAFDEAQEYFEVILSECEDGLRASEAEDSVAASAAAKNIVSAAASLQTAVEGLQA